MILPFSFCLQIAGLLIGAVPQFQKLLVGHSAPLGVIQDSVTMLG